MNRKAAVVLFALATYGLTTLWAPPAEAQTPDKSLKRALKFYGKKQFLSATVMLHRVLTSTVATTAQKQQAEFVMAKALYHKRFYAASLLYFDRVVATGSSHKYFYHTLPWLAALQAKLPINAGVLAKIGKYPLSAFNAKWLRPVRNQLLYLLGRYYMRQGDKASLDKAIKIFKMVK